MLVIPLWGLYINIIVIPFIWGLCACNTFIGTLCLLYFYGDFMLAERPALEQLVDAVEWQIARHVGCELLSNRYLHSM